MILNKLYKSNTIFYKAEKRDRMKTKDKAVVSLEKVIRIKLFESVLKLNRRVNIFKVTTKRRELSPDVSSKDKFSIQLGP